VPALPAAEDMRKHVSYHFKRSGPSEENLGESQAPSSGADAHARRMIQFGDLLQTLNRKSPDNRGHAVTALNDALHAKLLMDELKPQAGSLGAAHHAESDELGEGHSHVPEMSFSKLLHEHKKNMVEITKFLMERKKEGQPLTTHEDDELQKFYYNRASTILKKIVLLKKGEKPPSEKEQEEEDENRANKLEGKDSPEIDLAREQSDAAIARLKFDAKIANANAAYNRKMLQAKKDRMKAALASRAKAYQQSTKAAQQKMKFDQKVADAETSYNKALSDELLREKRLAEERVKDAAEQKDEADHSAEKATEEADEADKEAAEAEKEAELASQKAQELEAEAEDEDNDGPVAAPRTPVHIPISVTPHTNMKAMLRYLTSAINHHLAITPQEQQLMQSYFLKHGSALLSQLAQVDPDATWHSKGVVQEEQYEMDRQKPDQLSKEWGSKDLKAGTVMHDFMADVLHAHKLKTKLMRPGVEQAIGVFGSNSKLALKFKEDDSIPTASEPRMPHSDLGESDNVDAAKQSPMRGALSAMMGITDEEESA